MALLLRRKMYVKYILAPLSSFLEYDIIDYICPLKSFGSCAGDDDDKDDDDSDSLKVKHCRNTHETCGSFVWEGDLSESFS